MVRRGSLGLAMLVLLFSAQAFSQSASIGGIVTDASGGVLPGAKITVTLPTIGFTKTVTTNNAGAYSVPGLQVGNYQVTTELSGFQTQTKTDVSVSAVSQLKINFEMAIAARQDTVQVSVATENIILESSSSVGVLLPEEKINELPLIGSNVLDLMKVMGGVNMTDSPTFGADRTTFAGISAANVNLQVNGVTANDVRWATGANSPVFLNPETVGEFKLVIAPVDAEMGRGAGQVQVVTRGGANTFHASGVWNIQNTALDSNQWNQNLQGVATNWRNQEEYTITASGPIIKNKTFFFASWDQQIVRIREHNINPQVLTPCAKKGIFRWFDGYQNGNFQQVDSTPSSSNSRSSALTVKSVRSNGTPRIGELTVPSYMPNAGQVSHLLATSVFGPIKNNWSPESDLNCDQIAVDANGIPTNSWVDYTRPYDALRVPDTTGYVSRFMKIIPQTPNNWDVGDGLNYAGYRWTRSNPGIDNVYGLGEGPERKQFTFRIDHNLTTAHRINGSYSWEANNGTDAQKMWPENSYGGNISRKPRNAFISLTSTLRPTMLNEFRWGYTKTESYVVSPLHNQVDDSATKLKNLLQQLYPSSNIPNYNAKFPVLIGLGTQFSIYGGSHPYGSGRGNFGTYWGGWDPRMVWSDTFTWTKGKHSFKFGAEIQRTKSYQEINGSVSFGDSNISYPYVRSGASVNYPNAGFQSGSNFTLDGMTAGNPISGVHNLLNMFSGSVINAGQYRFVNKPTALTYNDIQGGEDLRITDYRQNQFSLFVKDDWKVNDSLTLNLGVRYEWYGVPFLAGGMTPQLKGGGLAVFGRTGRSFDDWMPDYRNFVPGQSSITYKGADSEVQFVGQDSPNPNLKLYNDDWNNIGPAVGFAWQLPWGGKGKTTLRGGYQMLFQTLGRANIVSAPGITRDYNYTGADRTGSSAYMSLKDIPSLIPVPLPSYMKTPAADPVIPTDQRQQVMSVYDPNLRTPYVQTLTMSLTRNIGSNLTVDLRYVGNLSRKSVSSFNLNTASYRKNGLKELFDCARSACTDQALNTRLDKMFWNVSLVNPGTTYGPVGSTVKGVYQSGAIHLRQMMNDYALANYFTYFYYNNPLANGDYNLVADILARQNINFTYNPQLTPFSQEYKAGALLRYTGLPENFIYSSPQYRTATWYGNHDHANYHSMQAQITMRPKHGLSLSGTYTWSRNLGSVAYIDPTNRAADYGLLGTHREHAFTSYGTYDLPFGPNRLLASSFSPNIVGRIIGGWQISWIHTMQSGRPGSITTSTGITGTGRPDLVAPFDTKSGHVAWKPGARYGNYWNFAYVAGKDPQCANVTSQQGLANYCYLKAMYQDSNFNGLVDAGEPVVFQNPAPATRGNFDPWSLTAPLVWNTDMALTKMVRIAEGKSFQLRIDATNVFNHPLPSNGTYGSSGSRTVAPTDMSGNYSLMNLGASNNSNNRPMGFLDSKVGARTFQAKIRFDF
jgi:hypothetical protein